MSDVMEWPSGVGGAQCERCGRFTICRTLGDTDYEGELVCRPCTEGWDDDEGSVGDDE